MPNQIKELPNIFLIVVCSALLMFTSVPSYAVSCLQAPAKLNSEAVSEIIATLSSDQMGEGISLSNNMRALAASDSEALDAIFNAALGASADQKSAIGAGLARAAQVCVTDQPEYAALIQQKVAELDDTDLLAAFESAFSDPATAALGGTVDAVVTPTADGAGGGTALAGGESSGSSSSGTSNGSSSASTESSFSGPSFSGTSTAVSSTAVSSTVSPST